MKFKFKKRHNIYVTLLACAASLWLMIARFGLTLSEFLSFGAIILVFLLIIVCVAALAGWLIGRFKR